MKITVRTKKGVLKYNYDQYPIVVNKKIYKWLKEKKKQFYKNGFKASYSDILEFLIKLIERRKKR